MGAFKNHDATFFERFLSADHVEAHAYGIVGKAAVVDGARSSACVVQSYSLGPFSLSAVSADAVLATCIGCRFPRPWSNFTAAWDNPA